ncbi:macro domain-containing protein [Bacillus sp. NEAU-Y102]
MFQHIKGNVISVEAELLVNAANSKGWMGGLLGRVILMRGVAETIHYADPSIEKEAKKEARKRSVGCGDVFLTSSGSLGFPSGLLHAVTMEKPGQTSTLDVVEKCLENIVRLCEEEEVKTVAIPLLGAGTGKVKDDEVLQLYESKLGKSHLIFYIVMLGSGYLMR